MVIGDCEASRDAFQVAEHEVDGGKSADFVTIFNGGDLSVEVGGVTLADGAHHGFVGCFEIGAAAGIHVETVAEGGADVGEIDGGDDQHFFACGLTLEGFDNGS